MVSLDGTPATQVNQIVSHPTMSLLITAHEDKYIRVFDVVTGKSNPQLVDHAEQLVQVNVRTLCWLILMA